MIQYRKAILITVFAVMFLLTAGDWLAHGLLRGPIEVRRAKAARLRTQIEAKEKEFAQYRRDGKQMEIWEQQSLPSDVEVARGLYQAWLLELANHVGLAGTNVNSSEPLNHKGLYYVLSFSLRGRGTLGQLTKLLFEFYRCGHLHQLRSTHEDRCLRYAEIDACTAALLQQRQQSSVFLRGKARVESGTKLRNQPLILLGEVNSSAAKRMSRNDRQFQIRVRKRVFS